MLESYKVDARGNIQFQNGKPEARRAFKTLPLDEPLSRHSVNGKKVKNPKVINQIEERRKQIMKDVQQMTLYQGADLTPDTEGGPRRMYQKTEIQEGDKRIEILEIVECVDTTPDSSPAKRLYKTPKSIRTPRLTPRSNRSSRLLAASTPKDKDQKVQSKIPVSKPGKSSQRLSRSASRENSPNLSSTGANPNKDRAIADLLMEALNNNEGSTVEFVPSPKDYLKPPTVKRNVPRKTNQSGTRRSAHSGKYLTQFEVIPEERSGLSFDSSAEDSRAGSQSRVAGSKQAQQHQSRQSNHLSELSETTSSSSPKSSKSAASSVSMKQEPQKPTTHSPTSESSKRSSPPSVKEAPTNRTSPESRSKSDSDRSENSQSHAENKPNIAENRDGSGSESKSEASSVKSVKYVQQNSVNNPTTENKKSDTQKLANGHSVGSSSSKPHDPPSLTTTTTSNSSNNNNNGNGSKSRRSSFQIMDNGSAMDALNGNVAELSSKIVAENNNKKQASPSRRASVKGEHSNSQKGWASPLDSANEGICRHHLICVNL